MLESTLWLLPWLGRSPGYDAVYTIGSNGLRISRPQRGPDGSPPDAIIFFGCSMTFGEGVGDEQTMPWQVAAATGSGFSVFNFGFPGYGPHQMLAVLDHGIVDEALGGAQPRIIIFQTLRNHVWRSAGHAPWDSFGPRYTSDGRGSVVYGGQFNVRPSLLDRMSPLLSRSSIGKRLVEREWFPPTTPKDVQLYLDIVDKARELVASKYVGAEFHVLLWDREEGPSWVTRSIREGRAARKVPTHLISRVLPDILAYSWKYRISQDGHPTPLAHREIARYIVREILRTNPDVAGNPTRPDERLSSQ